MFKSGGFGGKSTTFTLFAFRYAVVALPDGLENHRAATAFLCGFSTKEWPPYPALRAVMFPFMSTMLVL